ncbi:hypothetical protein [Nonomuraea sp. NPDC050310]|uniref:hypothetical protein n=1 Tax=unclassified Nonomuraea TaxID=2593643 RepID=UPI0033E6F762
MSDQHIDPAGNTQQFRAFAHRVENEAAQQPKRRSPLLPILAVVLFIAIVAVGAYLLLK